MPAAAPPQETRAETIDLLRALAALSVVALHLREMSAETGVRIPGYHLGEVGVLVFFVLSGYLITLSVLSRSFTMRNYTINRVFRIVPAYLLSLFFILALQDAELLMTWSGWKNIGAHVLFIQGMFREYRTSINPVLWTLSIEALFYGFMLLGAPLLRRLRVRWLFVIGMVAVGLAYRVYVWERWAGAPGEMNFYTKQLPGVLDQFAIGSIAALATQHARVRALVRTQAVAGAGLVAASVTIAGALVLYDRHDPNQIFYGYWAHWYMVIVWPLAFAAAVGVLMISLQAFERQLAPWIKWSGLGFVGLFSYSLYLFHPLVLGPFRRAYDPATATVPGPLVFAMCVAAILVLAAGIYLAVEKPFMDARRRFVAPPKAPKAPSAAPALIAEPERELAGVGSPSTN